MTDNHARSFLAEIVAHPEDDAPRLIFADWLDEQRDNARAEFIRVQIERASLPAWDPRQLPLRLRESALLKEHWLKWKMELPDIEGVTWEGFRRGFMATATFSSFAALKANGSACWAAAPIEAVSIHWPRPVEGIEAITPISGLRELSITGQVVDRFDIDRLASAPLVSTLRALNIRQCSLEGEGFARLVASPHFGNLKALCVPGNSIGNRAIRALFDAASLTSLEELDLSEISSYGRSRRSGRYLEDPVIEAADLQALAGWSGLARLRSLNLSGNQARRNGLRALLRSRHIAGLKELKLRSNGLVGEDMQEFGGARAELHLDLLDLGDNLLGDVGPADLALAPCLQELKVLELDRCEIRLSGARWLVNAPFVRNLRRLNVDHNSFGPEGTYRLLEKKPPCLHTLLMRANDLGDEGAAHLAESPASDTLRELDIAQNGLGDDAAKSLTKTKRLRNLLVLRLQHNEISNAASSAFADSALGKRLAVRQVTDKDAGADIPS